MAGRYFEDLPKGARFSSSEYAVSRNEILAFAKQYDPQAFHLDDAKAAASVFKGLAASGWHTAAISMRLFIQTLDFAEGAVGLGVDELRWPNAVRPDDRLTVETEILDVRASKSKPDHGIIRIRNTTKNQRDEVVQTMEANALVPRGRPPTTDH